MRRLINLALLALYSLAGIAVFVLALINPQFRSMAWAPLRELVLPPPSPVVVEVLYSTEKEEWIEAILDDFYRTDPRVNGRPVELSFSASGSREIYLAVLDGTAQPDLISPASSLQISLLQDLSAVKFGRPVVDLRDPESCQPVVTTPLVVVAWKERGDALWGPDPNGSMWLRLHDALTDPTGWDTYGHPEWGFIKFGHTDPLRSNSGFMTILLMTYNYFDKTSGLTSADILSNSDYQQWLIEIEGTISEFGDSTGSYMREIITYGPSTYDMVAVYEATAIEQVENAVGTYGELTIYYPPATVLSDHPFCILDMEHVTDEKAEGARLFVDFLLSREAQEAALLDHGFRPVDPTIDIGQTGSPFSRYASNGFRTSIPPVVEVPPGDVLNTLLDFWARNIAR